MTRLLDVRSPYWSAVAVIACCTFSSACWHGPPVRGNRGGQAQVESHGQFRYEGRRLPALERKVASQLVRSASVDAGVIEGVVVDASNGEPLANAEVWLKEGDARVVAADGTFRLSGTRRVYEAIVSRLGYERIYTSVDLSADSGHAAVFAAMPSAVIACPSQSEAGATAAIMVRIRDALTGRAPSGEVTLSVHGPSGRFVVTGVSDSTVLVLQAGAWAEGTYSVEVHAPQRSPWTNREVRVTEDPLCGGPFTTLLPVWLLPLAQIASTH